MELVVNERQILIAAQELCLRARTDGYELATRADGTRCKPIDPLAVAWSPTGAVCKIEPLTSRDEGGSWADTTVAGDTAIRLLNDAAERRGFDSAVQCSITGGVVEEQAMFRLAVSMAPDRARDRRALR